MTGAENDLTRSDNRLVILASSLGTMFEWYDFFVYGTLAALIGRLFFPPGNEAAQLLLALATFGVGFGVRPLGAVLFGYLGDRLGRKYTFLITITLMGVATAAVGLMPPYAMIGGAAPVLLVLLRAVQGLALGGEYGGAAIYVAEHAPAHRRGFYTSFIQASVVGGFLLSIAVVLLSDALLSKADFEAWGWRIPFLFSLLLLAVSLWIRLKLRESPVFQAMKAAGETARNPLRESFNSWANVKLVLVVLFGVAAGLTVVYYNAQFQSLYFLQNSLRVNDTAARIVVGIAAVISVFWFLLCGWLSDKIGRKPLIVAGYALTLGLLFPLFHMMADAANPQLARAQRYAPVIVTGSDCKFDPFAMAGQKTACGRLLDALSKRGVAYHKERGRPGELPYITIGWQKVQDVEGVGLDTALRRAAYPIDKVTPSTAQLVRITLIVSVMGMLAAMTFAPVAALLAELFPPRIRYTSMSVPYHIGTGYFGGFLPFISQYIVARTGDPFAGIWYTIGVVLMALIVALIWLPETRKRSMQ